MAATRQSETMVLEGSVSIGIGVGVGGWCWCWMVEIASSNGDGCRTLCVVKMCLTDRRIE